MFNNSQKKFWYCYHIGWNIPGLSQVSQLAAYKPKFVTILNRIQKLAWVFYLTEAMGLSGYHIEKNIRALSALTTETTTIFF